MNDSCPACRRWQPLWDVHAYAEKIASGAMTSSSVSREVGRSRQAVDQALKKHGLHYVVKEGMAARQILKELEKNKKNDYARRYHRSHPRKTYTDEYLLKSMRAVHDFLKLGDQALGHAVYSEARPKHLPSAATIMDRFGTWNKACQLAGLPWNEPVRSTYSSYPREKAVEDVARYIVEYRAENGRYARISNARYEQWAMNKENKAISRASIAKRWGWSNVLGDAFEKLYGDSDAASGS